MQPSLGQMVVLYSIVLHLRARPSGGLHLQNMQMQNAELMLCHFSSRGGGRKTSKQPHSKGANGLSTMQDLANKIAGLAARHTVDNAWPGCE